MTDIRVRCGGEMSHIACPSCGSNEHMQGYGLAAGPMGSYTLCECGELLEFVPDLDGLTDEQITRVQGYVADWRAKVWGAADQPSAESR